MPYAQWHYPFENQEVVTGNFPADYICEAIDQTRGWFYSLHALATLLTDTGGSLAHIAQDSPAFKNAIVLGHIVDEKGEKMSKSKGNTVDPWTVLDAQGANALRWYLDSTSPPENTKRFSQGLVEDTLRDFLMTLWNTYSFLVLYANLDQPDLQQDVPVSERPEIDRWLVSKINVLIRDVTERLEAYDPTSASRAIRDFVVNDLSNWYVRRNRRRFWKSENDGDKLSAYKTLYETMVIVAKVMAPMAPFVSEHIYQNLVLSVFPEQPESVHLANWEKFDATLIDTNLLRDMETLIRIVELGRAARATAKVKIRQPLGEILVRVRNQIEVNSPEGYAAIEEYGYLAALNTQLTSELIQEGVVREAIRLLQEIRKKAGLNLSDRIHLGLETSGTLLEALKAHLEIVKNEVLAQEIRFAQIKEACYNTCVNINDIQLRVTLQKISSNGEVD